MYEIITIKIKANNSFWHSVLSININKIFLKIILEFFMKTCLKNAVLKKIFFYDFLDFII